METVTQAVQLFQELSATTSQFATIVARRVNASLMRLQSVCMTLSRTNILCDSSDILTSDSLSVCLSSTLHSVNFRL